jgi:hypothetical protein
MFWRFLTSQTTVIFPRTVVNGFTFLDQLIDCQPPEDCGEWLQVSWPAKRPSSSRRLWGMFWRFLTSQTTVIFPRTVVNVFTFLDQLIDCQPPEDCGEWLQVSWPVKRLSASRRLWGMFWRFLTSQTTVTFPRTVVNVFTFLDQLIDCQPPEDCGTWLKNSRVYNQYLQRHPLSNKSAITAATEIEAFGQTASLLDTGRSYRGPRSASQTNGSTNRPQVPNGTRTSNAPRPY